MESEIDATVPEDDVLVDKALLRRNFEVAKNEITSLLVKTGEAGKMAYSDTSFDTL